MPLRSYGFLISHLRYKHAIHRGSRNNMNVSYINYIKNYYKNPKCACGCGIDVLIHNRGKEYNLFADTCNNKNKYLNPACVEFYLFNGKTNENEIITTISELQSKNISRTHKELLIRHNIGTNNPSSIKQIMNRTGMTSEEAFNYRSSLSKGRNNGFYGKKHKPETLRRLAIIRSEIPKAVTKPELIIYGMLLGLGINFKYQCPVDIYTVDFIVNNIIIEVYGDYWHSDKFLCGEKVKKDKIKEERVLTLGYKFIKIWESDIMKNPKSVINILKGLK